MTSPTAEDTRALWAAEIGALRTEINFTINRMNGNENLAMAGVIALWTGAFGLPDSLPRETPAFLALLAVVLTGLCWRRYEEMRRHLGNLGDYVKSVETRLAADGGWETGYAARNRESPTGGFSMTRAWYWRLGHLATWFALAVTLKPD